RPQPQQYRDICRPHRNHPRNCSLQRRLLRLRNRPRLRLHDHPGRLIRLRSRISQQGCRCSGHPNWCHWYGSAFWWCRCVDGELL
ncbi:hypothetical protein LTR28_005921, partial [Elasticomyces elasticus]